MLPLCQKIRSILTEGVFVRTWHAPAPQMEDYRGERPGHPGKRLMAGGNRVRLRVEGQPNEPLLSPCRARPRAHVEFAGTIPPLAGPLGRRALCPQSVALASSWALPSREQPRPAFAGAALVRKPSPIPAHVRENCCREARLS